MTKRHHEWSPDQWLSARVISVPSLEGTCGNVCRPWWWMGRGQGHFYASYNIPDRPPQPRGIVPRLRNWFRQTTTWKKNTLATEMTGKCIKTVKQPSSKMGKIKWLFPEEENQWKMLSLTRSLGHPSPSCGENNSSPSDGRKEKKRWSRTEQGWRGLGSGMSSAAGEMFTLTSFVDRHTD